MFRPTSALASLGPIVGVEVALGPNKLPVGYREVEVYLQIETQGGVRLQFNLHLMIRQEALEQFVRGLRAAKNEKETTK